ncbi:unnamed protein product [Rangifer tarandus platyrhynchus]|uniref:Uncharacterized protein n=1 Tax=Rangifer tarandus platyrhynchus TaxID=3082113 RepID=A0AC59YI38_RANTA
MVSGKQVTKSELEARKETEIGVGFRSQHIHSSGPAPAPYAGNLLVRVDFLGLRTYGVLGAGLVTAAGSEEDAEETGTRSRTPLRVVQKQAAVIRAGACPPPSQAFGQPWDSSSKTAR